MDKDFAAKRFKPPELNKKKNSQKEEVRKTSRGLILGLFIGTISLSLFLWKKPELGKWWGSLWQPATYEIINPEIVDEQLIRISQNLYSHDDVIDGIRELVGTFNGVYGVYVEPLEEGATYGINQDEEFTGASVNKVLIMAQVLLEIEEGKLDFKDEYRLQKKDIQDYGTGSMRYDRPGKVYTIDELLDLTGKVSDNTAAWVLNLMVGKSKVQDFINELGMEKTSIEENTTTPAEMGQFFSKVYHGKILSESSQEKLYQYLTRTEFEGRIPVGVSSLVSVAHKIGTEAQVINDCGIIFDKKYPYILCIFSKEAKESQALEVLPKISALVWAYESQR